MGNICKPRKINFAQPKRFSNFKFFNYESDYFNHYLNQTGIVHPKVINKDVKQLSTIANHHDYRRSGPRDADFSNDDQSNSVQTFDDSRTNFSSDSSVSSSSITSISSGGSNDEARLMSKKAELVRKFKKTCLSVDSQRHINVSKVNFLLSTASRINFALLVDIEDQHRNTAVCIAIIKNDTKFLQCLLKFIPNFPSLIMLENSAMPLVQVAAEKASDQSNNSNILSIILQKWIEDDSYASVAHSNIFIRNADSKSLLEFLIDKIREKNQLEIQFTNLELLFQLFKRLSDKNYISNVENPEIHNLCKFITDGLFWTDKKRSILLGLLDSEEFHDNYLDIIRRVCNINDQ